MKKLVIAFLFFPFMAHAAPVCDGSTDDTAAFEAYTMGVAEIPTGTCIVCNVNPNSYVTFKGQGVRATVIKQKNGCDGDAFFIDNKTHISFKDFSCDGNRTNNSINASYGSCFHTVSGSFISQNNLDVYNWIGNWWRNIGTDNVSAQNIISTNNRVNGYYCSKHFGTGDTAEKGSFSHIYTSGSENGDGFSIEAGCNNIDAEDWTSTNNIVGFAVGSSAAGANEVPRNITIRGAYAWNNTTNFGVLPVDNYNVVGFYSGPMAMNAGVNDEGHGNSIQILLTDNNGVIPPPTQDIVRVSFSDGLIIASQKNCILVDRTDGNAAIKLVHFSNVHTENCGQGYSGSGSRYNGFQFGYGEEITCIGCSVRDSTAKTGYGLGVSTGVKGYYDGIINTGATGAYSLFSTGFSITRRNEANNITRQIGQVWIGDDANPANVLLHGNGPIIQFKYGSSWGYRLRNNGTNLVIEKYNGSIWVGVASF